ncbi:MAG: EamA family transporter [Bdellovibrionales bacterium]|nr:EamA family transporter [Bdellovibrionales bacterium]
MSILSAVLSAVAAANVSAAVKVIFRKSMCSGGQARALLQYYHIAGALMLVSVFGFPAYSSMPTDVFWLLVASSLCWTFGTLYRTKAYRDLEASETNIIGTLSLVLITAVAIVFFDESLSVLGIVGMVVILLSIAAGTDIRQFRFRKSVRDLLVSVLLISSALVIDRILTRELPIAEIAVSTFLLPSVYFLLMDLKAARKLPQIISSGESSFFWAPLLGAVRTCFVLFALAHGSLAVTYALLNTCVIFVFAYETVFLQLREGRMRRGAYCLCCALGAVMVTAYG